MSKIYELINRKNHAFSWKLASRITKYYKKYLDGVVLVLITLVLSPALQVATPYLISVAIDKYISTGDLANLGRISLGILGLAAFSLIINHLNIKSIGTLNNNVLLDIRKDTFRHLQDLPMQFYAENKSGDIIQRVTNDVDSINNLLTDGASRALRLGISLVGMFILMYFISPQLTLVIAILVVILVAILLLQKNQASRINKSSLDSEGGLSFVTTEILNNFKIMKSYGQERTFQEKFDEAAKMSKAAQIKATMTNNIGAEVPRALAYLAMALILYMSIGLVKSDLLTLGRLIAFVTYINEFYRSLGEVNYLWGVIQRGMAAISRILDVLGLVSNIREIDNSHNPSVAQVRGEVEFKDVTFYYEKDEGEVLKNLNLHVAKGQKIAIIGPTGTGKTTFVKLIARLYDTISGQVLVDGKDVRDWDLRKLRSSIGYLLQDTFLFKDSLINNITYPSKNISRRKVEKALSDIGAEDLVKKLPRGLDTIVGGDLQNLSYGQKQLVAIARILVRDPKILILDEATSNIDTRSEQQVQSAIQKAMKGRTSFVIAHRLNTIESADKIIFIQGSEILESGTKEALLAKKGRFYRLHQESKAK